MIRILVAEDDSAMNKLVCNMLTDKGYEPVACFDGAQAMREFERQPFDMVITDIMMPNADGYRLAEEVRQTDKHIPILFMTALDDKLSQQRGFRSGADDYVTKPFDADILLLRVEALLRRANIERSRELTAGNLRMNKDEHTAYLNGEELPLTVREFDLLFKLLSFPKRTFTRAQLMDEFWDFDSSATSRTVDVYMSKLREKTADCDGFEILTVHGLGYKAVLR
ncbi:MAG TPA: response regulator transcription factor [Candidatus Borkfalkia excrementipullorum]|nr:response regulator transcription factor [Candidatus Borkfalkia excrementipullorum]